jgi:hypothetical protein
MNTESDLLNLSITKRTDERLLKLMSVHYSAPKGFVGRNICYSIECNNIYYGHIVAGSATRFLPGRHNFLGTSKKDLNRIINNIFYHIEPMFGKYPRRNFVSYVIKKFREAATVDWLKKYGDIPVGFESLVELPRKGTCYIRDGWELVGQTKGFTCKRVAGTGSDSWSGKRVWNTKNLRPKLVFCKKA